MICTLVTLFLATVEHAAAEKLVSTDTTEWANFTACMDASNLPRSAWNITINGREMNVITHTSDEVLENQIYTVINECQDSAGIGFSYNAVNLLYQTNPTYFMNFDQYMAGDISNGNHTLPESAYINPLDARLSEWFSYNARIHHKKGCGGRPYQLVENWKADGVCIQPVRRDGSYFDVEGSFGYDYNGPRVWLLTCPHPRCKMMADVRRHRCIKSECNIKHVSGSGNAQCFSSPVRSFQWIPGWSRPYGYCDDDHRVVYATQQN